MLGLYIYMGMDKYLIEHITPHETWKFPLILFLQNIRNKLMLLVSAVS
jgi:hypothetical protein